MSLTATQLADSLGVSKARISQLVNEGRLDGTFTGDGRARRFDLQAVAQKLNRVLDAGQMTGNGLETKRALRRIMVSGDAGVNPMADSPERHSTPQPQPLRDGAELPPDDIDRLEMAKIIGAEEDARRKRRMNQVEEGTLVLASAAAASTQRLVAQEIAEFETALRTAARAVADQMGVDFKAVRTVMLQVWRDHRAKRAKIAEAMASEAEMTDSERAADI